jgi:hypothetical protein
MSKGPATFRMADLKRGMQALKGGGAKVKRVEVQPGKIVFVIDDADGDGSTEREAEIIL